jgi:hypothetical protein
LRCNVEIHAREAQSMAAWAVAKIRPRENHSGFKIIGAELAEPT